MEPSATCYLEWEIFRMVFYNGRSSSRVSYWDHSSSIGLVNDLGSDAELSADDISLLLQFTKNKRPCRPYSHCKLKDESIIMILQIRLCCQWSYTGRVQILHGGHRKEGCIQSFQLERKTSFFKSRCRTLLFNFESFLTLKGASFSDFGKATRGGGICLHL